MISVKREKDVFFDFLAHTRDDLSYPNSVDGYSTSFYLKYWKLIDFRQENIVVNIPSSIFYHPNIVIRNSSSQNFHLHFRIHHPPPSGPPFTETQFATEIDVELEFYGGRQHKRWRAIKVTVYLQMDNFLQIWIFVSKYRSKCDL